VKRVWLVSMWLALAACRGDDDSKPRAEFGVLFGGDIQDRERLVLEADPSKQELGVRVTFAEPVAHATRVSWEIERPSEVRGLDGGTTRAAELGGVTLGAGERRADGKFAFRAGDPPGSWRVRVLVDGQSVLERSFEVVLPEGRARPATTAGNLGTSRSR
jgi:hypothetical protein